MLINNKLLALNQVHETLSAVLRERQRTLHCVAWPSLHKMWGDPRKYCQGRRIEENILPDSQFPVSDTCIKEIALKAIFDESGR